MANLPGMLVLAGAVVGLSGCYSTTRVGQRYSSGVIPCAPHEIAIAGYDETIEGTFWEATCRGVKYRCSLRPINQTACAPIPASTP